MADLQKYNTLAEAIAYNLSDEELRELEYDDKNGLQKISDEPDKGLTDKIEFYRKRYSRFSKTILDKVSPDRVERDELGKFSYEYTSSGSIANKCHFELDTNDNLVRYGSATTMYEIDRNVSYDNLGYIGNNLHNSCIVNGTNVGVRLYEGGYLGHHTYFGEIDGDEKQGGGIYEREGIGPYLREMLETRIKLDEDTGKFYIDRFEDFRWLENKKIFKMTELKDKTFYNMSNLIPAYTVGFVFGDVYKDTVDENLFKEFENDIKNNWEEIITNHDKLLAFEEKYQDKYLIYYRSDDRVYFSEYNICAIMAMFVADDGKEQYPLNKSGYIDYGAIDYRKQYTMALGAAKVSPKILTKILSWSYGEVKSFTNKPEDPYGVPTTITLTNQIFRPNNNTATLTVTLGHTKIDGKTYNDELQDIFSKYSNINIQNNQNGTYTISFKSTNVVPKKDYLIVPVKNTFNDVVYDTYFDLDLLENSVTETIRLNKTKYKIPVNECGSINGYLFYERNTNLTADEKKNISQTDLQKAIDYICKKFVDFPTLPNFDPKDFKSVICRDKGFVIRFNGKELSAHDFDKMGLYKYTIKTIKTEQKLQLSINLIKPPGIEDPLPPEPPRPIDPPPSPNPPKSPGDGNDDKNKKDGNTGNISRRRPPRHVYACYMPRSSENGVGDWIDLNDELEEVKREISYSNPREYIIPNDDKSGKIIISGDYQGGYLWHYNTGKLYTNKAHLVPKKYITVTFRTKRHIPLAFIRDINRSNMDMFGRYYFKVKYYVYNQSFILVEDDTEKSFEKGQDQPKLLSGFDPRIGAVKGGDGAKTNATPEINADEITNTNLLPKLRWRYAGPDLNNANFSIIVGGIPYCATSRKTEPKEEQGEDE